MQLFSRKKALFAASLSALVALGACGDNVTVPPPVITAENVTISPPSATLNVGEKVAFAVQISGGSSTAVPTLASCTSSNTAVASVALTGFTCTATAVAAGNATITAASTTGKIAAAQVTVAAPAPAINGLSLTPAAANVSVGGAVTITANPTSTPNGVTVTRTFATSSASIATVTAAGVVTGIAPGTATITASVTGAGTGFTTTTLSGSVTVTVTALPPGVTAVNVTPQAISLIAGLSPAQTATLVATASQPTGAAAATITYGTSNPAVATVSSTGVVTAAGSGAAIITVTATSAANASFSASTATVQVPVTVGAPAQVIINSLTDQGATIDITNVAGQFEVNLSLQPNGQIVSSVQAFVCNQGEAQAACIARGPAAQQTFGAAGGQAGPIQLYINSAEFTPPDFTVGADANTLFKNGLKTIVATVTAANSTAPAASNNLSQINFNNQDGLTIAWTQPTNRANDAAGITWYGGPTTPDPLVPGSSSGRGSFTIVPVIYTPNRTIASMFLTFTDNGVGSFVCGSPIQATQRPFTATYGSDARSTTQGAINFFCSTNAASSVAGAVSDANGYVPSVSSSIDNNNAAGPNSGGITPLAATSIFTPISASSIGNPTFAGRYRQSLSYRPTTIFIPGDYRAPVFLSYDVKGGGGAGVFVDSAWTNAAYGFAGGFSSSTGNPLRLSVTDNQTFGVGLLGSGSTTSARNTQFLVCNFPTTVPTTSAYTCTSPIVTGTITSTVGSVSLGENATDFTNSAYVVQVVETDRLGNRQSTQPFGWSNSSTGQAQSQTPGTNTAAVVPAAFGVDITAPVLVALPNSTSAAGTNPFFPNFVKTDADSIYSTLGSTYGGTNATNAVFAVRFNDSRSGFSTCTIAGNNNNSCALFANGGQVNAGTFAITRRTTNQTVSLTNDAVVEGIVTTSNTSATLSNRFLNVINANIAAGDPANREFSVNIFGATNRVQSNTVLSRTPASSVAGYYTFTGTIVDRAGNTTVIAPRSVAIDNQAPQITGIQIPAILQGATTVNFVPAGTDDLEAISGDLALTYPQVAAQGLTPLVQPSSIRFRRVPNFGATALLGLWHNPFASVTDNKLASPVGPGLTLSSSGLNVPIPFIQQIQSVDAGDAPLAPLALTQASMKPTAVTAWLYGIRATETSTGTPGGLYSVIDISAPLTQALFDGQITQNSLPKNWGTAAASSSYQNAIGIGTWAAFDVSSPSTVEFRVSTSTSVTNPPFTRVEMIRAGTNEWTHLGQATYAGILDQGATRFWRYTFSFAGISQGQTNVAALANLDVIRAIGTDAAGNGLSTNNWTIGGPVNSVTSVSVSPSSVFVPTVGGTYPLVATAVTPSGAIAPSITYSVGSNVGFIGGFSVNNAGVVTVGGGFNPGATGTIIVTATGVSSTGFIGNIATATVTFNSGVPGISAVSITGSIPSTLTPGQTFSLTATPTQPSGAPTPTYSWTVPAGFTITNSTSASPTYTYTGATPINGTPVSITVTASTVQNAPGFSAGSASSTTTNAAVNGFQNQDSFGLAVSIPQATINAGSAYQSTITNTNPAGLAISNNCFVNTPFSSFATVSNTALIAALGTLNIGFTSSAPVGVTCSIVRAQQTVGGVNYAARTVSSNVSTVILPFGTQSVTLSPSGPSTVAQLQTLVVNASAVTSTGASAVTFALGNGANGGAAPTGACTYTVSGAGVVTVTAPGATATCTYTIVGITTSTAYTGTAGTGTVGNAVSSSVYTVNVP